MCVDVTLAVEVNRRNWRRHVSGIPVSGVWCAQLGHKFLVTSFWYQKLGRRTWVVCHPPYSCLCCVSAVLRLDARQQITVCTPVVNCLCLCLSVRPSDCNSDVSCTATGSIRFTHMQAKDVMNVQIKIWRKKTLKTLKSGKRFFKNVCKRLIKTLTTCRPTMNQTIIFPHWVMCRLSNFSTYLNVSKEVRYLVVWAT